MTVTEAEGWMWNRPSLPWKHSFLQTFDGALALLKQDRGSKCQTAQLGNPPNISTFPRSGARYVTPALYTWQGRLILCCIWERMALLTAFILKFLTKGGRAASHIWVKWLLTSTEQNLVSHTNSTRHITIYHNTIILWRWEMDHNSKSM